MVFFLRAPYIFSSIGAQETKIHYPVMDRMYEISKIRELIKIKIARTL